MKNNKHKTKDFDLEIRKKIQSLYYCAKEEDIERVFDYINLFRKKTLFQHILPFFHMSIDSK